MMQKFVAKKEALPLQADVQSTEREERFYGYVRFLLP